MKMITEFCLVTVVLFVGMGNCLPFGGENSIDVNFGEQFLHDSQQPEVGQRVLARWTNNLYYKGRVSAISQEVIAVEFDDSDKMSYHPSDKSAMISDTVPSNVKYQDHVIATWKGGKKYYIGFVIEVDQTRGYKVRFDDNDEDWYSKDDLRMFPYMASPYALGSRVFARWTNKLYYRGFVTKVYSSSVFISYDDGDTITLPTNDPSAVIADILPECSAIQLGQKVIGYWPNRVRYYSGTISALNSKYFVQFDDGDKRWNEIHEIRVKPL